MARPVGHSRLIIKMNSDAILNVQYEDLPEVDKQLLSKATEEFQDKCLMSYARMRDKIIQKNPLPRVLLHGQRDTDEEAKNKIVVELIHKSVHDALGSHNEVFLNTFRNIMKECFYGASVDQVGPSYFNAPHPSAVGSNKASTSQQPTDGQVQPPLDASNTQMTQPPSGQLQQYSVQQPTAPATQQVMQQPMQSSQMGTFDTSNQISSSAQKYLHRTRGLLRILI